MATIKTKGIVIGRTHLGEADRILTIITPDRGKIRVVAKGARKPRSRLGGFLEMFRYNEYLLAEGRNLDIITGAHTIDSFSGLSRSLRGIALAYYVAETVDRLVEETQEVEGILELVHSVFQQIGRGKISVDLLKNYFEMGILARLGFRPELDHCVECRGSLIGGAWFSFGLGGILDRQHRASDPVALEVSPDELNILRKLISEDLKSVAKSRNLDPLMPKVAQICSGFLDYIVDRNLRSKEFLSEVAEF